MSKVFVYTYHRIFPRKSYEIGLKLFEFHLKIFKKFFKVLSWEEFKAFYQGDYFPKKRAVFITFDDGYVDNYVYAYPLLKKYNLKAHLFVTPSRILNKPILRPSLEDYWSGKKSFNELFKPKPMWEAQKEFFQKGESSEFLSWEELRKISEVFTFGSHGMSHAQGFISENISDFVDNTNINRIYSLWKIYSVPKVGFPIFERKSDLIAPIGKVKKDILEFCEKFPKNKGWKGYLKKELLRNFSQFLEFETEEQYLKRVMSDLKLSKQLLEKNLGVAVDSFSYPWGDYSGKLLPLVKKFYKYAFTVEKGNVNPKREKLKIPRVYAVKDIFTFMKHIAVYGF
jgi:peptidoglycan/xylan/chitin deacetylase (PgdA/CDA1 family)